MQVLTHSRAVWHRPETAGTMFGDRFVIGKDARGPRKALIQGQDYTDIGLPLQSRTPTAETSRVYYEGNAGMMTSN